MAEEQHDGTADLFDLEEHEQQQELGANITLTPAAEVKEDPDYVMPNLHMGKDAERFTKENMDRSPAESDEIEIRVEQAIRIEVSKKLVEVALETTEPVGIPINLTEIVDLGRTSDNQGSPAETVTEKQVVLRDVPEGVETSEGERQEDGTIIVDAENIEGLLFIIPPGVQVPPFQVVALVVEVPEIEKEVLVEEIIPEVEIDASASAADLDIENASGNEDTAIALDISAKLTDTDGSETLSLSISDVPTGAVLSAGTDNGDGTWTLDSNDLEGLTITPPADSHDDFSLTVNATTTETNGATTTVSESMEVRVDSVIDGPGLTVSFGDVTDVSKVGADTEIPTDNQVFHFSAKNIGGDGSAPTDGESVNRWEDISGNNNDAISWSGSPTFDESGMNENGGVSFGSGDAFQIADSAALNTSTYTQKSFAFSFETGDSVAGDQMIYEQGGTGRGYSLSISADAETGAAKLFAFVWNKAEWASGEQYQVIDLGTVDPDTDYSVIMVLDSTSGDGTFAGYVNGELVGQLTGIPAQNGHAGDASFGSVKEGSVHPVTFGAMSADGSAQFQGTISEAISWNDALSEEDIAAVTQEMTNEWGTEGGETTDMATVALDIDVTLIDGDGSQTISITLDDLPAGATLSAGTDNGDGTWTLYE